MLNRVYILLCDRFHPQHTTGAASPGVYSPARLAVRASRIYMSWFIFGSSNRRPNKATIYILMMWCRSASHISDWLLAIDCLSCECEYGDDRVGKERRDCSIGSHQIVQAKIQIHTGICYMASTLACLTKPLHSQIREPQDGCTTSGVW